MKGSRVKKPTSTKSKRVEKVIGQSLEPKFTEVVEVGEVSAGKLLAAETKRHALMKPVDRPIQEWAEWVSERPESGFMTVLGMKQEEKYEKFFDLLTSPIHRRHGIAQKAKMCNISPTELIDLMQQANQMTGMLKMAEHMPVVMLEQAENAKMKDVVCPECKGKAEILETYYKESGFDTDGDPIYTQKVRLIPCTTCFSTGTVKQEADAKTIDRALKLNGMLQEEGRGVKVQVNTQVNVPEHEATVTKIGQIIEEEVLDVRS